MRKKKRLVITARHRIINAIYLYIIPRDKMKEEKNMYVYVDICHYFHSMTCRDDSTREITCDITNGKTITQRARALV